MEYECVDPQVGRLLERGEENPLDPEERAELDAHLEICQSCRVTVRMDLMLREEAARYGHERAAAGNRRFWTGVGGVLRLAAVICLLLGLAAAWRFAPSDQPRFGEALPQFAERAEDGELVIERPREREVLPPGGGDLRWTRVPGASHYRVDMKGLDGFDWSDARVRENRRALPDETPPGDYLAKVRAVPEHLGGGRPAVVSFRRGSWGEFLRFRVRFMPLPAIILLSAAIGLGLVALSNRRL